MKELLDSLSIWSGSLVVALISVVIVCLLYWLTPKRLHTVWVVTIPFVVACCLYWTPVWLGNDSSEYSAWALLFVGWWFLAGAIPSAAIVALLRRRRSR